MRQPYIRDIMSFKTVISLIMLGALGVLFFFIDCLAFSLAHFAVLQLFLALFLVLMTHQRRLLFVVPGLFGLGVQSLLFFGSYEWLIVGAIAGAILVARLSDVLSLPIAAPVAAMAILLFGQALRLVFMCGLGVSVHCTLLPIFVNLICVWLIAVFFEKFGTRDSRLPVYRR